MRSGFRAKATRADLTGRLAVIGVGLLAGTAVLGFPSGSDARPPSPAGAFVRGLDAFRAGDYVQAEQSLRPVVDRFGRGSARKTEGSAFLNDDWALYLHAESAFFAGSPAVARSDFERLSHIGRSRFAEIAAFRAADCLWSSGAHAEASERYRRLLAQKGHSLSGIDIVVPRFRVALFAEETRLVSAPKLFQSIYREVPAHPLAAEARRHFPDATTTTTTTTTTSTATTAGSGQATAAASVAAADQLHRAETLTRDRHWNEALDELSKLPPGLPATLAVERDYQIGMTKFQMRRDYAKAAQLLLAVVPALSGDTAASALFHGTRALSRIDRDDEAIAGYKQVVSRFPRSRFAAEAQFLSGWLDYNRGRFRESLPGLTATLDHFGASAFADDAAWCLAFAHFLLGELPAASTALDRYARMPPTGMTTDERAARVAYWRARFAARAGRSDESKLGYREVNRRWPFSFYGVAARARLGEAGETVTVELPRDTGSRGDLPRWSPALDRKAAVDPTLARADELAAAGLDVEAGWELQRDEKAVLHRWGDADGTRVLLDRYPKFKAFHRLYELGESRHGGALNRAPDGGARPWWEAAYPRAYHELVDRYGPPAGNPDLFLYAIMRKESGFSPWDTSTADARGLLQMIPPTSAQVAAAAGLEFSADELFDPDTNIRLGAMYIGALAKKFGGQIPIVAGAFNAGPKAMAKWCDQHGRHPMDEFVELIAFTQTREYAKRVVGIFSRYRHLYGATPYQMPITVDPKYAATGPDY